MNVKIETVEDLVTVIQVCAWAFVVTVIMFVFGGTVFSMLYSVIFVSQPIKTMAPIDQAFTKMLNDIVLLLTGSISTIAGMYGINKGSRALANKLAPTMLPQNPCQPNMMGYQPQYQSPYQAQSQTPNFNWMNFNTAELDENWRPPPPPTTPPTLEHEEERERMAAARAEAHSDV